MSTQLENLFHYHRCNVAFYCVVWQKVEVLPSIASFLSYSPGIDDQLCSSAGCLRNLLLQFNFILNDKLIGGQRQAEADWSEVYIIHFEISKILFVLRKLSLRNFGSQLRSYSSQQICHSVFSFILAGPQLLLGWKASDVLSRKVPLLMVAYSLSRKSPSSSPVTENRRCRGTRDIPGEKLRKV